MFLGCFFPKDLCFLLRVMLKQMYQKLYTLFSNLSTLAFCQNISLSTTTLEKKQFNMLNSLRAGWNLVWGPKQNEILTCRFFNLNKNISGNYKQDNNRFIYHKYLVSDKKKICPKISLLQGIKMLISSNTYSKIIR